MVETYSIGIIDLAGPGSHPTVIQFASKVLPPSSVKDFLKVGDFLNSSVHLLTFSDH